MSKVQKDKKEKLRARAKASVKAHAPLAAQLMADSETGYLKAPKAGTVERDVAERKGSAKDKSERASKRPDFDEDEEEKGVPMPSALSQRILQRVAEQQQEEADEDSRPQAKSSAVARTLGRLNSKPSGPVARKKIGQSLFDAAMEEDHAFGKSNAAGDGDNSDEEDMMEAEMDGDMEEIELSPEDEKALQMFMPSAQPVRKTLADIIMEKIHEKERGISAADQAAKPKLDPRVVQVYTEVSTFLKYYRSGKVPKAFKIIPSLKNWEEVLFVTQPENWSPQAVYVATKLFASNLNQKMAQRFYNLVLLPRFIKDIELHKKLNYHLYQAIKKAIFKPAAFFKGLLLPLAEEGCSLRETVIMASILTKCSIPVLHSSVALLKLAQMPYSGTTCLFMKTLLDKKYSLPYKVVDALVKHFCQFSTEDARLPVIWHQNLFTFVARYKDELTATQKTQIRNLLKVQTHHTMTTEIRRELTASESTAKAAGGPTKGMDTD